MFYSIRHITRFHYSAPVNESVMEVRMRPRSDSDQRCLHFALTVNPKAHVSFYRDHLGNTIHHFDVPGSHTRLGLVAESTVEVDASEPVPDRIDDTAWHDIDAMADSGEYFEFIQPSQFATPTALLKAFASEIGAERRGDPLSLLRELNSKIFDALSYVPKSTDVDPAGRPESAMAAEPSVRPETLRASATEIVAKARVVRWTLGGRMAMVVLLLSSLRRRSGAHDVGNSTFELGDGQETALTHKKPPRSSIRCLI